MSRTRRMSRWLIAMTAIVLALGLIFWVSKLNRSPRTAVAAPMSGPASPLELAAPATQPTVPAAPSASAAPATQPTATGPQPLVMTTPAFGAAPTNKPALLAAALEVPAAGTPASAKPAAGPPAPAANGATASQVAAPALSGQPLADAKVQMEANQLLEARRILNAALSSGTLPAPDAAAAKKMLDTINATVVFSPTRFNTDRLAESYKVNLGDKLAKIAAQNDVTADLLLRVNKIADARRLRAGQTIKLLKGPFCAVVSKKNFTMEIYQGDPSDKSSTYITSFPVGLGKDDSTPTGTWMVKPDGKLKNPQYTSPRGEGVIPADDPNNPLGERWIGLEGIDGQALGQQSYGIHGTIEPESIGKMESMGCIRLKNEDIERVYEMLVEGKSTVVVTD